LKIKIFQIWLKTLRNETTIHWPHFCLCQLMHTLIQSRTISCDIHNIRTSSVSSANAI